MPFTRPREISDRISLSDKLGREEVTFVSEDGAVDSVLPAVIDELAPNKERVSVAGSKDDVLTGPDELGLSTPIFVCAPGIVSFIERKAGRIAVLRQIPERVHTQRTSILNLERVGQFA